MNTAAFVAFAGIFAGHAVLQRGEVLTVRP